MNVMRKICKKLIAIILCVAMVCPIPVNAAVSVAPLLDSNTMLTMGNTLVKVHINQRTGRYVVST